MALTLVATPDREPQDRITAQSLADMINKGDGSLYLNMPGVGRVWAFEAGFLPMSNRYCFGYHVMPGGVDEWPLMGVNDDNRAWPAEHVFETY